MAKHPHLVHVVNSLLPGAVPNILRDLQPEFARHFRVTIVALEPLGGRANVLEDLEDNGAEIVSLECPRRNVLAQFWRLRKYLNHACPDVAHAHLGRADVLTPLCAPPVTFTVATHHTVPSGHWMATRLLGAVSNLRLGQRTFVSHAVARSWVGDTYDPANVVYNPVRGERFFRDRKLREEARRLLNLAPECVMFLNVGRLIQPKGQADLIKAAGLLRSRGYGDFRVMIAGDGPLHDELLGLVSSLSMSDTVTFLGHRNDINSLLSAADVFVFPSHFEGLGLAPIEAMASRCPVFIADYASSREFVDNGITAQVFPVGDVKAIADIMEVAVRDRGRFLPCAENAAETIAAKFGPNIIAEQYVNIYRWGMMNRANDDRCQAATQKRVV